MTETFDDLMRSVVEMDEILRGEREPSSVFRVETRELTGDNQSDIPTTPTHL